MEGILLSKEVLKDAKIHHYFNHKSYAMSRNMMSPAMKSTLVGILLVLACAIGGGVGVATLLVMPFGYYGSILVGISYITSAIICWMWACFARRKLYE